MIKLCILKLSEYQNELLPLLLLGHEKKKSLIYHMVVLVCQERKMDTAVIVVVSPPNAGRRQMGTGKFKRIIDQFSFSGKRRKEVLPNNDWSSRTSAWLVSSRWKACPVLKRNQSGKVFKEFSGTTCTFMVKEGPLLNGNLSIHRCFVDVSCDLRKILALTFDVFDRFCLRGMIHDPVSITRIAFKDKTMGFRINIFNR